MLKSIGSDLSIDIVMGTYNGARYIAEQIRSIQAQDYRNWRLWIRDDGSRDGTLDIVRALRDADSRIHVVDDVLGNLGVVENFNRLLQCADGPYVILSDQDDVWVSNKISRLLEFAKLVSGSTITDKPLLVFSDLRVVDQNLKVLDSSYMKMQGRSDSLDCSFPNLITQNVTPGCSMMVNRALMDVAMPVPPEAEMHDWWLIQVAAQFGKVCYLPEALVDYRQHDANVMGAFKTNVISAVFSKGFVSGYRMRMDGGRRQAIAFNVRYGASLSIRDRMALQCYGNLGGMSFIKRRLTAMRSGLRKDGFLRTLVFYAFM